MTQTSTPYPPGARIVVREAEWMVRSCTKTEHDGYKIRATGVSELVRDEDAVFFTQLENRPRGSPCPGCSLKPPYAAPRCRSLSVAWRCRTGSCSTR